MRRETKRNISGYDSKEEKYKDRIKKRFLKKPKGRIIINLKNGDKLAIEYMYGQKYCLMMKPVNKRPRVLLIADKIDAVVNRIIYLQTGKTKKINIQPQNQMRRSRDTNKDNILKYFNK